jgi:hypothetical protein
MTQQGRPLLVVTAAFAMFAVMSWWSAREVTPGAGPDLEPGDSGGYGAPWVPGHPNEVGRASSPASAASGLLGRDEGLQDHVAEKYRFLLDDVEAGDLRARLQGALLARESIAVAINTLRQDRGTAHATLVELDAALMRVDSEVIASLPPGLHRSFALLRHSDMEQFQLDDYAAGMAALAPLDEAARRAVLFAKLEHREPFRDALSSTGFMQTRNPELRQAALASVTTALEQSHAAFLASARRHLADDEQYALLENYETTELRAELRKLRELAEVDALSATPRRE